MAGIKGSIYRYYAFQFFDSLAFFSPIIYLFWQSNGLTMTQIMTLQSIYSIGVLILELPTGAFADRFGRRRSLMIGSLIWTVGLVWYGYSHSFWQFVCGELMVGTGSAFISGADRAYLHELLRAAHREQEFKKVEGKARGIIQIAQAVGSIAGGLIGAISLGYTLIATGFATFVAFLTASTFPQVKEEKTEQHTGYLRLIGESISLVRHNKRLLWLTLYFACFNGLVFTLMMYSQPLLQMLHIPVALFGVVYFAFNMASAAAISRTHRFETLTKNNVFRVLSTVVVLVLLIVTLTRSPLVFFFLWPIIFAATPINHTIISDFVLKLVPSSKAATVLSFQSLVRRLVFAITAPILGMATDALGIQQALFLYAIVLGTLFTLLLVKEKGMAEAK